MQPVGLPFLFFSISNFDLKVNWNFINFLLVIIHKELNGKQTLCTRLLCIK